MTIDPLISRKHSHTHTSFFPLSLSLTFTHIHTLSLYFRVLPQGQRMASHQSDRLWNQSNKIPTFYILQVALIFKNNVVIVKTLLPFITFGDKIFKCGNRRLHKNGFVHISSIPTNLATEIIWLDSISLDQGCTTQFYYFFNARGPKLICFSL